MLKKFVASIITALALTTGAFATDIKGIAEATFQLWSGNSQICSTQVIKSDDTGTTLLTAYHCIDPDKKDYSLYKVELDDKGKVISEKIYKADVKKKNKVKDVAVLELRDKSVRFPTVEIATNEEANKALELGVKVLSIGYPGSMYATELTLSEGLYAGKVNSLMPGLEFPYYRTSSTLSGGASGSGLYVKFGDNDDWKLVGIASQADPTLPGTANLFAPIEGINAILATLTPETVKETLANK